MGRRKGCGRSDCMKGAMGVTEVPVRRVCGALEGLREAVGIHLDDASDRKDDDGWRWAMGGVTWGLWRRDPARHQESG